MANWFLDVLIISVHEQNLCLQYFFMPIVRYGLEMQGSLLVNFYIQLFYIIILLLCQELNQTTVVSHMDLAH